MSRQDRIVIHPPTLIAIYPRPRTRYTATELTVLVLRYTYLICLSAVISYLAMGVSRLHFRLAGSAVARRCATPFWRNGGYGAPIR